jgi:uncharacterized membrane protein YphA (DoxX/SURF4 family)
MKAKLIAYWVTTSILVLAILSGGVSQVTHQAGALDVVTRLGYPLYFVTILGIWKVLGAVALLAPRFPRLKEWAYAGIFFEMTGAAASHAACGDYGTFAFHLIVPLLFAGLAIASWALRPQSRTLAVLPAVASHP